MKGYFIRGTSYFMVFSLMKKKKDNVLRASLLDKEVSRGGQSWRKPVEEEGVEVPKGFFAVYAGKDMQRFVISTSYLSLPAFRALMERAAEEFGFEQRGVLRIPCEEKDFEEILKMLEAAVAAKKKRRKDGKILASMRR